jgi:hypothetical protein
MTATSAAVSAAAAAIAALALLTGCTAAGPTVTATRSASASPTPAVPAKLLIAAHLVTQEGLAIALASNVLQTQLTLVQDALNDAPAASCTGLTGGGAHQVSGWGGSSSARTFTDTTFYDTSCTKPYLTAVAAVNPSDSGATASATVTYTGATSAVLGVLTTSATASFEGSGVNLEGTGTFTRTGLAPVSLGLACQSASDTVLNCQGGVAQDFADLGHSLGSITPLQLTVGADTSQPISFQGSGNSTAVAALGALRIASPDSATLSIQGGTPTTGATTTSGQAGGFVLFPPTPTGWTVTDTAGDVSFAINVVDNTSRALTATVTQLSTKKVLATLALDQSGTGTISYVGEKPAVVASWMLTR